MPIARDTFKTQGFTLIELMIALVIGTILVMLAAPSFNKAVSSNLVTTQANNLVSSLNLARSEAVKQSRNVTICASTNETSCSAANIWTAGWIVFVDTDADTTVDAGDTIIRVQQAFRGATVLTPATTAPVQFNSQGLANTALTFTLTPGGCNTGNPGVRVVTIGATGRAGVTEGYCT